MEDACDRYLDHLRVERNLSPRTLEAYARDLAGLRQALAAEGVGRPADVAAVHLTRWLAGLSRRGLSATSQARALSAVRSLHKLLASEKLAEKDPTEAYRMFYNVGASIWNAKGDVSAAIAVLQKSVELKPDFPKSRKLLGDALLNQGKLAEARAQYEKFLELAPGDPQAGEIKKMVAGLPKK